MTLLRIGLVLWFAVAVTFVSSDAEARRGKWSKRTQKVLRSRTARCPSALAVRKAGRTLWCGKVSGKRRISKVVWSPRGDAGAFVTRSRRGKRELVVVITKGPATGRTMTWPVVGMGRQERTVPAWLGARRVGVGVSAARPKFVVSWNIRVARR